MKKIIILLFLLLIFVQKPAFAGEIEFTALSDVHIAHNKNIINKETNYEIIYNKALACHANEDYKEAIASYETILQNKKDEKVKDYLVLAYLAYGKESFLAKDYKKAIEIYEKALT